MAEKNMDADINVEFEESASRQQLNSGESVVTLFGKIKKFFADLKAVAFSGAYSDLSGTPDLTRYATKTELDTKAEKALYGDTTINVGRAIGSKVGDYSTAEGSTNESSDFCSHAEGNGTTASGFCSHTEGNGTTASGSYSHAGGYNSTAQKQGSFAHGGYVNSTKMDEVAFGKYNKSSSDTLFSVGDGTSDSARHNAFEITTTGGKLHDKDIATTDIIPDLSAYAKTADVPNIKVNEAVNADTLGGKSADDFARIIELGWNETDTKTAVSTSTKTTIYHCSNWTDFPAESPDGQGVLIAVNYNGLGIAGTDTMWVIQFFISARTGVVYKRYINGTGVDSWKEISTTPIKSTTFSSTADGTGNFNLWTPNENKVPIFIQLDNKPFYAVPFVYNNQVWLGSTINEVTRQPVTDTTVSGTVYYIEI